MMNENEASKTWTSREVQRLTGKSFRTIQRWEAQRGFPKGEGEEGKVKTYDRAAVERWWAENKDWVRRHPHSGQTSAVVLTLMQSLAGAARAVHDVFDRKRFEKMSRDALKTALDLGGGFNGAITAHLQRSLVWAFRHDPNLQQTLLRVEVQEEGVAFFFDEEDDASQVYFALTYR